MKFRAAILRIMGVLIFVSGVLLGVAFSAGIVWGYLEATLFDPSGGADSLMGSLHCPLIVTPAQPGIVTASAKNPSENKMTRNMKVHISEGYLTLMREINDYPVLEPGETKRYEWTVTADDAVFDRLILVRAHLRGYYPYPSEGGSCGILVVDILNLTGGQVVALAIGGSTLFMAAGVGLWIVGNRPSTDQRRKAANAMMVLAGVVLAGMLANLGGWWLLAGILLLISVLVMVEVFRHYVLYK
jgi:hypothetical protein